MTKAKRFTDVLFADEITTRPADHEVLMTFCNDVDALAFREWWDAKGAEQFQAWLDEGR